MRLNYRISLWNYFHYHGVGTLESVIESVRNAGYGVEIWPGWFDEQNLFDPAHRSRLKALIGDIPSSIHGGGPDTIEHHRQQIDTAADTNCDVVVVHSGHMRLGPGDPDLDFAREVLDLATTRGIVLALENGPLETLLRATQHLDELAICLDVGHAYFSPDPLRAFIDRLKHKICHLHLQDILEDSDHYVPGTGNIPRDDWEYLFRNLDEIGFEGASVLEIRPRDPLQHAAQTRLFLDQLLPT